VFDYRHDVTGTVSFEPKADTRYAVRGTASGDKVVEVEDTKQRVTADVVKEL
jgi:hypothetical protein